MTQAEIRQAKGNLHCLIVDEIFSTAALGKMNQNCGFMSSDWLQLNFKKIMRKFAKTY